MKTKAYVAFLSKAITYERDIEILDVLSHKSLRKTDVDKKKHSKIAKLSMTKNEVSLRISHLKSTLYEGLVKNAYEIMMWYFRDIVDSLLRNGVDPVRVADKNLQPMPIAEIIKAGSWNSLCNIIASKIVRELENFRDTQKSVEELAKRLSITIDSKCLDDAKPYFEIRHLLVHNNGNPDAKFKREYPSFIEDEQIKLRCPDVKSALQAIRKFVDEFDKKIIAKAILSQEDCQP